VSHTLPQRGVQQRRIRQRGRGFPAQFRAQSAEGRGYVKNLSEGGLFVGGLPLPCSGEEVTLEIQGPDRSRLRVSGLVWWTTAEKDRRQPEPGFGVRLFDAGQAYEQFFRRIPAD
jgi:Tfp pilus assembly protein PilZ